MRTVREFRPRSRAVGHATARRRHRSIPGPMLAITCSALVSCTHVPTQYPAPQAASTSATLPKIPTPNEALLKRPPKPDCKIAESAPQKPVSALPDGDKSQSSEQSRVDGSYQGILAAKTLVEFERDCYRNAEQRARSRLTKLQKAVRNTKRAIDKLSAN